MNLIPKLAEMLGVEIGEHFKVTGEVDVGGYYYFTNNDLSLHVPNVRPDYAQYRTLADLVMGDKKIIKLPFEPKEGDCYWEVYWNGCYEVEVGETEWTGDSDDYFKKFCGNCFRTKSEAETHKYEIYEKLTGKKWENENTK